MGIVLAIAAILIAAYALCLLRRYRREAERLSLQLGRFLSGEETIPSFSVEDDAFAPLENGVVELETRLINERERRKLQNKKSSDLMMELSHQLKTPLASMRLYAEMDAGEHASQQIALVDRMERLIFSLLRLERLQNGGILFEYKAHKLYDIVNETAEGFRLLYPDKKIRIYGDASLRCDGDRLAEALANLVKNACEHTEEGGHIDITISRSESSAFIVIEDDGGGVPESDLSRLFERFFRSERSCSYEGSGVGLGIVREIVRLHHGSIQAENADGGLRFSICLPDLSRNLKLS